jgi:hypothetical protein
VALTVLLLFPVDVRAGGSDDHRFLGSAHVFYCGGGYSEFGGEGHFGLLEAGGRLLGPLGLRARAAEFTFLEGSNVTTSFLVVEGLLLLSSGEHHQLNLGVRSQANHRWETNERNEFDQREYTKIPRTFSGFAEYRWAYNQEKDPPKHPVLLFEAGYRHQEHLFEHIVDPGADDPEVTRLDLTGPYALLGLRIYGTVTTDGPKKPEDRKPARAPRLEIRWVEEPGTVTLSPGDRASLAVVVANAGTARAPSIVVGCSVGDEHSPHVSVDDTRIGGLDPGESRRASVSIRHWPAISEPVRDDATIRCRNRDGARAESEPFKLVLRPADVREKFPPILAVSARFSEPSGNGLLDALETAEIELTIENAGRGAAWNLVPEVAWRGLARGRNLELGRIEPIRHIGPGETATRTLTVSASKQISDRDCGLAVEFHEGNGFDPAPVLVHFGAQAFLAPALTLSGLRVDDRATERTFGDGDEVIENMETVLVRAELRNVGQGAARDVQARIRCDDPDIYLEGDLTYALGSMEPGQRKTVEFTILVNNRYDGLDELPIELEAEERHGEYGLPRQSLGLRMDQAVIPPVEVVVDGKRHHPLVFEDPEAPGAELLADLPPAARENRDAVAVVIANRNYTDPVADVEYAHRDGRAFFAYLKRAFGVRPGNVIVVHDATTGDLQRIFGTAEQPAGQLADYIRPDVSDVFVYYSGHGAPALAQTEQASPYLLPTDCDPQYVGTNGYSIRLLYRNLGRLSARSVTIILESCFSGFYDQGSIYTGISPVVPRVERPDYALPNGTVFLSTGEDQVSSWYPEKRHGLFTYFFLLGLRGAADVDEDQRITTGELASYLAETVPYQARRLRSRRQVPRVEGDMERVLVDYRRK